MRVLVDTGPLVAIASARDEHHGLCLNTIKTLHPPLLTCWPVIAEAAWLLQRYPVAFERILEAFRLGTLEVLPVTGAEAPAIGKILKQYSGLRPQFADAMLVYLARRESIDTIFTLDRLDFSVYRSAGRSSFRLLPESPLTSQA